MTSIEKRSRAIAHPPFLRGLMAFRGVLDNPLTDRQMVSGVLPMEEAFAAEAERIGAAATARRCGRALIGSVVAGYRIDRARRRRWDGGRLPRTDERLERPSHSSSSRPRRAAEPGFRERFIIESRLAAAIDHSHVVPMYEAGEVDGDLYLAMRYVDGTTLRASFARTPRWSPRGHSTSSPRSPRRSTPRTTAVSCTATSSPRTCSSPATVMPT